jgi:DNA-binding LytR/AlgR family response regulator
MLSTAAAPATWSIPGYAYFNDFDAIMRLEGNGNYSYIYIKGRAHPLLVSQTLKYFEDRLLHFVRVSKSMLVNPAFIQKMIQYDAKNMHLWLTDGTRVDVARRRIETVVTRLRVRSNSR